MIVAHYSTECYSSSDPYGMVAYFIQKAEVFIDLPGRHQGIPNTVFMAYMWESKDAKECTALIVVIVTS